MHFEFVRQGVMTALWVALARTGFAQQTVADRLIALPPIRSAGRRRSMSSVAALAPTDPCCVVAGSAIPNPVA